MDSSLRIIPSLNINPIHLLTQMSNTSASIEDSTLTDVSLRNSHGLISDLPARSQGVHSADTTVQRLSHIVLRTNRGIYTLVY